MKEQDIKQMFKQLPREQVSMKTNFDIMRAVQADVNKRKQKEERRLPWLLIISLILGIAGVCITFVFYPAMIDFKTIFTSLKKPEFSGNIMLISPLLVLLGYLLLDTFIMSKRFSKKQKE
ncbi:hypothetical protein [Porphyromonas pogonae]|uniref:hypothetical protein n=1 Tax=Porphyromonas pogonae TaxID=867595 RepID=UPI002E79D0A9|nr:hypothetical protein [Porphyromonas pogonae]